MLTSALAYSQSNTTDLVFGTKYYNAVDKWVAFPKDQADTTYMFGFIYIDSEAGFTFDLGARFQVTENGLVKLPRIEDVSMKARLTRNTSLVAVLSDEQLVELELPAEPEWLHFYKANADTPEYMRDMGFHCNAAGASERALPFLTQAYALNPKLDGLAFELAYAYNATGRFKEAIPVLEKAIEHDPKNAFFYREQGFAFKNLGQLEAAEQSYNVGMKLTKDKQQKAEMAINMAQAYAQQKDVNKFNEWAKLTRKYSEKGSRFLQYIDAWEKELERQ